MKIKNLLKFKFCKSIHDAEMAGFGQGTSISFILWVDIKKFPECGLKIRLYLGEYIGDSISYDKGQPTYGVVKKYKIYSFRISGHMYKTLKYITKSFYYNKHSILSSTDDNVQLTLESHQKMEECVQRHFATFCEQNCLSPKAPESFRKYLKS